MAAAQVVSPDFLGNLLTIDDFIDAKKLAGYTVNRFEGVELNTKNLIPSAIDIMYLTALFHTAFLT